MGYASRRALPPTMLAGAGFLLFGAIDMVRGGTRPAAATVIGLALTGVVFFTYFILGVVGYRLSGDGTVQVAWPYAWVVVFVVVLGIGVIAYLALRSLPQPSR